MDNCLYENTRCHLCFSDAKTDQKLARMKFERDLLTVPTQGRNAVGPYSNSAEMGQRHTVRYLVLARGEQFFSGVLLSVWSNFLGQTC